MKQKKFLVFILSIFMSIIIMAQNDPVKIGVIGLTHTHVHWIFDSEKYGDIKIVGIVETNKDLAERYAKQHGYSMNMVYNTMEEMIEATHPEAVSAFGTIYEHLEVVEKAAPLGIHVMVEKPLAVNLEHAKKWKPYLKNITSIYLPITKLHGILPIMRPTN